MTETTYNFTKSGDFNNNLKSAQLHNEINESAISTTLLRIDTIDDNVYIVFENALSGSDETLLGTLVSSHTPILGRSQFTYITPNTSVVTNTSEYTQCISFSYSNDLMGDINEIEFVTKSTGPYSIRLVNTNNADVICEETDYDNNKYETMNIVNINYSTETDTILELQVKLNNKKKDKVYINSMILYHGNS